MIIKNYIKHPIRSTIISCSQHGYFDGLSDKTYIKILYFGRMGKFLHLKNPKTYCEKLQWLKLYNRKDIYTTMVDKYAVKSYVSDKIGEEYVAKVFGVWDRFDAIDFDALPNQFVLKCNHDCGGMLICKDKSKLTQDEIDASRLKIEKSLKTNYYIHSREWPYKNVKPCIFAEEYLEDEETHELRDYKFFAFDGQVKALFIATERQNKNEETKFDFFDADGKHLPFINGHPNAAIPPALPKNFEEMKKLAAELSKGIPQVRIDFYEVNGKTYFGEFTFFHWGGMKLFEPPEWDEIFGSWITLPGKKYTEDNTK